MDAHDWVHTSVSRNSLHAELGAHAAKAAKLQEALKPIFSVMPKDKDGRLNNGTARYALHRFFTDKHGWSIKGLQPAGAGWISTMSVTPDVKDITKYMVPSYLQDLVLKHFGVASFDLRSLAVLAATIEHLVHGETISLVYSTFTTLGLPIVGKRTEKEVIDILDTFMMVYIFGLNLDVSVADDVWLARSYLENSHTAWPQLQVIETIGQKYVDWQGKDCTRVKEELASKPSYHQGRVRLSEVQPSRASGRRDLFTQNITDLRKLGVLSGASGAEEELIIANYVNSQSMCLSTASFYAACCVNECEGLLAKLEREFLSPAAEPAALAHLVATLPGARLAEPMSQELT